MNHQKLILTLIALLSITAPIVCAPTSRYEDLMAAQKNRELTSDEKKELQQLETLPWLFSSNYSYANVFSPHFDSVPARSCGPIFIEEIDELSVEQINEHTNLNTEFGSVVLSGLIKEEDASTEKIIPLEKDFFAPIISGYGPIWECDGGRYSRIQHMSVDDWKVIAEGSLEPLDACNQESNNNNNADKHITLTASLIAVHAQTDGVNYERLAKSLEQLHTFNTLQAQIDKLSHLDEID